MRSLTTFLAWLPGVMPRKASTLIYHSDFLSKDARRDLHARDSGFLDTVMLVGPDAAAAILSAYKQRQLPMKRGMSVLDAPDAEAYLLEAEMFREQISEKRRRTGCAADISLVRESDFNDHQLMNEIFFANAGKGPGKLTLAGIEVHKDIAGYKSNSGKSTGWNVTFSWTGSDGERRSAASGRPSEAFNRRNDEERNWGL